MEIRLQKVIAQAGVTSRRKAEDLIRTGRVTVNGRVVRELGVKVDPRQDHVKVDGKHLKPAQPHVFLLLNKPKGYVSTLLDPEGRPSITDLLHGVRVRVFPVGRLDFDSEGLVLLTNHGEVAHALLHPRYRVPKTYLVKVKGVLQETEFKALEAGVVLEDGVTAPARVAKVRKADQNSWVELTIYEGRKHQVKRMLEAVGHPVIKLIRLRMGPIDLGDLPTGAFRYLTDREANALRAILERGLQQSGPGPTKTGGRGRRPQAGRRPAPIPQAQHRDTRAPRQTGRLA